VAAIVHIEVTDANREADLRIADVETVDDVAAAVSELNRSGKTELILDLRAHGRPLVTLPEAVEAARETLAHAESDVDLRCLVASEKVAETLRARIHSPEQRSSTWRVGGIELELRIGDIAKVQADAVVNASNTMLKLGAGVSGALRRACGDGLQAEMSANAPIEVGGLAATTAHGLPGVGRILHVATAGGGEDVVRRALFHVLRYAEHHALGSVAIPGLGMGTGGLPRELGAAAFREELASHGLRARAPAIVRVVLWTEPDYEAFAAALAHDPRFSFLGAT
jgi:O-acetyl-ADP-ribose deacetylase (regulator of RNase III)